MPQRRMQPEAAPEMAAADDEDEAAERAERAESENGAARPSGRRRTRTPAKRTPPADTSLQGLRGQLAPKRPGQAQVNTLLRRQNVLALWTRGYSINEIASTLQVNRDTVRADIGELQHDLQRDILPELHTRVNRAVAVRQAVQQEAWQLYHALENTAHNKIGALDIVLRAQEAMDRLTGVAAPEQVNATVVAELQASVMEALYATGGKALQQAFLQRLRAQATTAKDFYPPDLMQPGERRALDDFLPPPVGYIEADSEAEDPEREESE